MSQFLSVSNLTLISETTFHWLASCWCHYVSEPKFCDPYHRIIAIIGTLYNLMCLSFLVLYFKVHFILTHTRWNAGSVVLLLLYFRILQLNFQDYYFKSENHNFLPLSLLGVSVRYWCYICIIFAILFNVTTSKVSYELKRFLFQETISDCKSIQQLEHRHKGL